MQTSAISESWDVVWIPNSSSVQQQSIMKKSEGFPRVSPLYSVWQRLITALGWSETSVTLQEQQEVQSLGTQSIVAEIDLLLEHLQKLGVRLGKQEEICEYLLQYPDLIEVIPRAINAAQAHLLEAHLFLELYHDPEIEDRYLVIYARFPKYDESVMERIEAAEEEYLGLLAEKEGWLLLTTDFREPGKA